MTQLTLAELQEKMEECRDNVAIQITALNKKIDEQAISIQRADELRVKMSDKLDAISAQTKRNFESFRSHTNEEMEKYDTIIVALGELSMELKKTTIKTKENGMYIESKRHNEELEDRVAEKMLEQHKKDQAEQEPIRKRKEKVVLTAIGVVTTGLTGGIMGIGYMVLKNYMMMQGVQ